MKYKLRYFYSKGAFLVLVWMMLVSSTLNFLFLMFTKSGGIQINPYYKDQRFLLIPIIAFTPIAGSLADVRYGNLVYYFYLFQR